MGLEKIGIAATMIAALTACGGGGGDSGSTASPTVNAAEGLYSGSTTNADAVGLVVLNTGETWGLVADSSGNAYAVFQAPSSTTSGASYTANQSRFYEFGSGAFASGTITATFNASTFSGTASGDGGSVAFNLAKDSSYNTPAVQSSVTGVWDGSYGDLSGAASLTNINISSSGAISLTNGTCNITGTITPKPNISVYTVSLQYRIVAGCAADANASGIGIISSLGQLIIGLATPDRNQALAAFLTKRP